MSTAALIADLYRAGVRLERRGDRLRVEAPNGTVTPELRMALTAHKADLLAALSDPLRAHLLELAGAEGIDPELIQRLPRDDVEACRDLTDAVLRTYVVGLAESRAESDLRERGRVPLDETARALCRRCGLVVWVAPEVAAVAPVVDDMPVLQSCGWCFTRNRNVIPRPPVTCGDCQYFTRDKINPNEGMGHCGAGCDQLRPWPDVKHQCATWRPRNAA